MYLHFVLYLVLEDSMNKSKNRDPNLMTIRERERERERERDQKRLKEMFFNLY